MKICLVTEHYPPHIGGVETMFYEYAIRLAAAGHEVRVLTSTSGGLYGERKEEGVNIRFLPTLTFFGHPLLRPRHLRDAIAWADVVHTTTYTAAWPAFQVSRALHKPVVLTVHEMLGNRWSLVEQNWLRALLFQQFERFVVSRPFSQWHAVSEATKAALIRFANIPPESIRVIHHGIDATRWHSAVRPGNLSAYFGRPAHSKLFLFNGRLGQTKGATLLLEAIRLVRTQLPDGFEFAFLVSTDHASEFARFQRLVQQQGLAPLVHLSHSAPAAELPGLRKAAYAMVVPSLTEGFGFTAAESAALHVPLLVSDVDSLPEVVGGQTLFFRSGDARDLADKLLLATRRQFENRPSHTFSWDTAVHSLLSLYTDLHAYRHDM